ncbi:cytochrome c [Paraflavitalea sp. CAU 1676]|uniref:c-type cytochrome n=1 Tax=Paraflavitalea sp. CAU 1676 TaxID=3032598 RepID=UPI0023DAB15E|nr:cytochrome c [Paraflavitalea sp. CAU 1676]MDF2187398.1 cytochrome c [Paraflavitalea sp. CAU 1676]
MNKEVGYIGRGFLLMLVVLAGLGIVRFLSSTGRPPTAEDTAPTYITITDDHGAPRVYNARGRALFDTHCSTCHKLDKDDGDMLRLPYVEERITDKALLYGWIRNNDSVLKSGNKYFNALYERWNKTAMTAFPNLSDQDIDAMLEYLRQRRK